MNYEMAWTDGHDWWALFVRAHVTPEKFVGALQDPDDNHDIEDESFDPYDDVVREVDVKSGYWYQRPVNDEDACDVLQWIYEECDASHAGAFPVTWLPLP